MHNTLAAWVAMREENDEGSEVYYILTDHLGSPSITVNDAGQRTAQMWYKPWGETREVWGEMPTDRTFQGRLDPGWGLKHFGARWFDSALGRFAQADTIIPGAGNPLAWDRYAGLGNNPVRYTDPSGHEVCDEEGNCYEQGRVYKTRSRTRSERVWLNPVEPMEIGYGWDFEEEEHPSGVDLNPDNPDNQNPDVVASSYGTVYSSTACTVDPCVGTTFNANNGYGNVVIVGYSYETLPTSIQMQIPEGATLFILYAHLDEPSALQEGTKVSPGQLIGTVGNTGASYGPHLHLEIRIEDNVKLPKKDLHVDEGPETGYTNTHFIWHNQMTIKNPHDFFTIR